MRSFVLAAVAALLAASGTAAQDAVQSLQGTWQGEELMLSLDVERGQGRVDPARPFQWERLIIKSVAGNEIVFTIGPRLYVATIGADELRVEAPGLPGPQQLRRVEEAEVEAPGPASTPTADVDTAPATVPELRPAQ